MKETESLGQGNADDIPVAEANGDVDGEGEYARLENSSLLPGINSATDVNPEHVRSVDNDQKVS